MRQTEKMMRGLLPERHIEDKMRLLESLDPSRQRTNQALRLQESLGIPSPIERAAFAAPAMPGPLPDLKPAHYYHLEALTDIKRSLRSQGQQEAEGVWSATVDHIRHEQEALREDQQLVVYCDSGGERFQVLQFTMPNHYTVILVGVDIEGNRMTRVATMNRFEVTSKVVTVAPPAKPYRIGFITPD